MAESHLTTVWIILWAPKKFCWVADFFLAFSDFLVIHRVHSAINDRTSVLPAYMRGWCYTLVFPGREFLSVEVVIDFTSNHGLGF